MYVRIYTHVGLKPGDDKNRRKSNVRMLSKKELEDIRPWVSANVTSVLGFSESTVVSAALDCVAKSLSRQATAGRFYSN